MGKGVCGAAWARGLVAAAALACVMPASGDEAEYRAPWRWIRFTTDSGLPSNDVHAVIDTRAGTPWAVTAGGLAWFDGYEWIPVRDVAGETVVRPRSVRPGPGDEIIIVDMGASLLRAGRSGVRRVPVELDGQPARVGGAVALGNGDLLVAATVHAQRHALLLLRDGAGQALELPSSPAATRMPLLWPGAEGTAWLNTSAGLYRLAEGRWQLRFPAAGNAHAIAMLVEDSHGHGIVSIEYPIEVRGLWEWRGDGPFERVADSGELAAASIDIAPDDDDAIVIHTSGDVRLHCDGTWRLLDPPPAGLSAAGHVAYRASGDLWSATSHGAYLLRRTWRAWTGVRHGFPDLRDQVNEVLRTRDGATWVASGGGVEVYRPDGSVEHLESIDGVHLVGVTALAQDGQGNVWIGSGLSFPGAFRWDGRAWRHFGAADGLACPRVHDIRCDRRGRPWFLGITPGDFADPTAGPGAFVLDGASFVAWGRDQGLPSGRVYTFAEAPDGSLWFGTAWGLARHRAGTWRTWVWPELPSSRVDALDVDSRGRCVIGSQAGGVARVDETRGLTTWSARDGLPDNDVLDVRIGEEDRIWAATKGGLACYDDGAWLTWGERMNLGAAHPWPVRPLGDEVLVGSNGAGWGTLRLSELSTAPPRLAIAPAIQEEGGVLVRWKALAAWGEQPPEAVLTRHRLDGGAWSSWTARRELALERPAPGEHRIDVEARALSSAAPRSLASTTFVHAGPAWKRPLVLVPATALLALVAALAVALAVRRRHDREVRAMARQQRDRADRAESLALLAGGVAHDFNNLLVGILGHAGLALRALPPDSPARRSLEEVEEAATRAADLANRMLAVSGRSRFLVEPADVAEIVRGVVQSVLRSSPPGITVTADLPEGLPRVMVDRVHVESAVGALITNATEAIQPLVGTVRVSARCGETDGTARAGAPAGANVVVEIADTGKGMDEATAARMYEPFFSTKPGGRGLGLAAVRGIMRSHHGAVLVDTAPGEGTTVRLYFPVRSAPEGAPVRTEEWPRAPRWSRDAPAPLVLVVDDEPSVRKLATAVLEAEGLRVVQASDGPEAIQIFHRRGTEIAVTLLDLTMPRMSGLAVQRELRAIRPDARIVLSTGFSEEELQAGTEGTTPDAFLPKPYRPDDLLAAIEEAMRR
jgi:signal transduction histidine kinase/ligand-binding sensor domain-containing protein